MAVTELITRKELACRFNVRPDTVGQWVRQNRIPEVRISNKIRRYDWQAVLSALSRGSYRGRKETEK